MRKKEHHRVCSLQVHLVWRKGFVITHTIQTAVRPIEPVTALVMPAR
jgi:hypothetical protein